MQDYDVFKSSVEEAVIALNQDSEKVIEQEETKETSETKKTVKENAVVRPIRQQRDAKFPKHLRLEIYKYLDLRALVILRNLSREEKESLKSS